MVRSVDDFLVQGHQKVIGHYKLLLRAPSLSAPERQMIESKVAKQEEELGRFIESVWKSRTAA